MSLNIWSEYIWLPEHVRWSDFEPRKINGTFVYFPQFEDLQYSLLAGVILFFVRIFIECFVFLPIGLVGGWISLPDDQSALGLCFRHLNFGFAGKSKFKRVAETAWRFLYYTTIWFVGLYVLHDQPQFWDLDESWRQYPFHPISQSVWLYYIVETGFYWSLLFSAFTIDVKRSDFWQMAVHHAVTILLLSMSFIINFVRVGTMVVFCHDTADILLEAGKLTRYARWEKLLTFLFCLLVIFWIGTRIFYFPLVIIRSVILVGPEMIQKNYRWLDLFQRPLIPRIFLFMLIILVCLHVFWTVLLFQIAYKSTQKSGDIDDIREDSSDEDSDQQRTRRGKKDD
ncbi:Ceramide synthase 5 [Aphelenchoides besseyi]|nr:Ceramide synthase 5 [Aphelenchoides besseyi]KAI6209205.1 Ceramide synthase 5 [Aphelenchoides besseyi]